MYEHDGLNREDLRKQLLDWMIENPMSFHSIAKELGVAPQTLSGFVHTETNRKPNFKILLIIAKFLKDKKADHDRCTR